MLNRLILFAFFIILGVNTQAQDSTFLQNESWAWVGEVPPDSLDKVIPILEDGTLFGSEMYYNKVTGDYFMWNTSDSTWRAQGVNAVTTQSDLSTLVCNSGDWAYVKDESTWYYCDGLSWVELEADEIATKNYVDEAEQNAKNHADGLVFSTGDYNAKDTTVNSDYTVPLVNLVSITSDVSGSNVVISLPRPVDSIKGNEVFIQHFDTTTANLSTTQIQTDFVNYDLYNRDTLLNYNLSNSGEFVLLRVSEVNGVLRWKAVEKSGIVVSDDGPTELGVIVQDTAGRSRTKAGRIIDEVDYETFVYENQNVSSSIVSNIFAKRSQPSIKLELTDTVTQNYTINLPNAKEGQQLSISVDYQIPGTYYYYLESSDLMQISNADGRLTKKYLLVDGEEIKITRLDSIWVLMPSGKGITPVFSSSFNFPKFINTSYRFRTANYVTAKSLPNGIQEDTIFVIKQLDKAPFGENIINKSESFNDGSQNNGWNTLSDFNNQWTLDSLIAPNGEKTADVLYAEVGDDGFIARQGVIEEFENGDTLTFSFWARSLHPSFKLTSIYVRDGVVGDNMGYFLNTDLTLENNWNTRYEYTIIADKGSEMEDDGYLFIEGECADTVSGPVFSIWGAQLEKTSIASEYKFTGQDVAEASDSLYIIQIPIGQTLNITDTYSEEVRGGGYFVQKAWDYCDGRNDCNTVQLDRQLIVDEPLIFPENLSFIGKDGESASVILYADIQDSSKNVITFVEEGGETSSYNRNQVVRGFDFRVQSPCRSVIEAKCGIDNLVENISIKAFDINGNGYTWADSLMRYGISTGEDCGPAGLDNSFRNIKVEDAWDYSFNFASTKLIILDDLRSLRSNKGLFHSGVDAYINSLWVEDTHNSGVILRGKQYTFSDTYFESISEVDAHPLEPQNDPTYLIDIDGAEAFTVNDMVITGVDPDSIDAYFILRNTTGALLQNYRGNQSGLVPLFDADCNNTSIGLINWNYTRGLEDTSLVCSDINIYGLGIPDENGKYIATLQNAKIEGIATREGLSQRIFNFNNIFLDTLSYDSVIHINSYGENLLTYSEDIFLWGGWNDLPGLDAIGNDTIVQGISFAKLKITSGPGTGVKYRLRKDQVPAPIQPNTDYLISFYTFSIDGYNKSENFSFQVNETAQFTDSISYVSGIKRHFYPFSYKDEGLDNSRMHFVFFEGSEIQEGDSLWVGGFQIQELKEVLKTENGDIKPTYIKTTSAPVTQPNTFRWKLLTDWVVEGANMRVENLSSSVIDTLQGSALLDISTTDTLIFASDNKETIGGWTINTNSGHYNMSAGTITYSGANQTTSVDCDVVVADTDIFENTEVKLYIDGVEARSRSYTFSASDTTHTYNLRGIFDVDDGDDVFLEISYPAGNQTGEVIISDAVCIFDRKRIRD